MNKGIKKILRTIAGIILIIIGLIGFVLPVMPGWVFLLIGLSLLSYTPLKKLAKITKAKIQNYKKVKN